MNNYNNWSEVLEDLTPNPEEHFFTKENAELIKSWLSVQNFNIHKNFLEWFENVPPCKVGQFLVIRKIGNILIQNHQVKLDNLIKLHTNQIDLCKQHLIALEGIVANLSVSPITDVKQTVISAIIETQLITQLTVLTPIREQIQELADKNTFCVECCE